MTDTAKVEPKRKRRWLQFSLRTLLIGVTLLALVPCGYIGWQAKIVRERIALLTWLEKRKPIDAPLITPDWDIAQNENNRWDVQFNDDDLPWWRRLLGDHEVTSIRFPRLATEEEIARVRAAFPESSILPYGLYG
jgi:hypothetical protein